MYYKIENPYYFTKNKSFVLIGELVFMVEIDKNSKDLKLSFCNYNKLPK